jgi:hypothetical protein
MQKLFNGIDGPEDLETFFNMQKESVPSVMDELCIWVGGTVTAQFMR